MASTPVISKGSEFILDYGGTTDLKSIIIEDPTPVVGEAEVVTVNAHDGTKYSNPGETGDNTLALTMLQTFEELATLMTYSYGAPSVSGSISTWDLSSPSGNGGTITINTPVSGTNQLSWRLKNATALSITPQLPIGGLGQIVMNVSGDNWEAILNEAA